MAQYYVDPAAGVDSTGGSAGGVSAPWRTTQFALNHITQGASGDRLNIKHGTDDVLSATLSLTTYGTPTTAKPLTIEGYTAVAGDGGIGGISGNSGNFTIMTTSAGGVQFINMHLHHTGTSGVLALSGTSSGIVNCEIDHATGEPAVQCDRVNGCLFHDLSNEWARCTTTTGSGVSYSRFIGTVTTGDFGILVNAFAIDNEIYLTAASAGTALLANGASKIANNSVYGNGSTGVGISDGNQNDCEFLNNVVEGFSGTGGIGFKATAMLLASAGNRAFNNRTEYSYASVQYQGTDYTDVASNFNAANVGDLSLATSSPARGVSYPGTYAGSPSQVSYRDPGAIQHPDPTTTAPNQPNISVTDNGNGTGATVTISGSSAGSTNTVLAGVTQTTTGAVTFSPVGTSTGDGTVSASLTPGQYLVYCTSTLNALYGPPSPTWVINVTSGVTSAPSSFSISSSYQNEWQWMDGVLTGIIKPRTPMAGANITNVKYRLTKQSFTMTQIIAQGASQTATLAMTYWSASASGYIARQMDEFTDQNGNSWRCMYSNLLPVGNQVECLWGLIP